MLNAEIRMPNAVRNPKPETGLGRDGGRSDFGSRASFGFRPSDFGFRLVPLVFRPGFSVSYPPSEC